MISRLMHAGLVVGSLLGMQSDVLLPAAALPLSYLICSGASKLLIRAVCQPHQLRHLAQQLCRGSHRTDVRGRMPWWIHRQHGSHL